jgi:sec-independent protein translocase protein TatA
MNIGIWQIVLILVVILIIFGAGKLPNVMVDVAKGLKAFKDGMKDQNSSDQDETSDSELLTAKTHTKSSSKTLTKSRKRA